MSVVSDTTKSERRCRARSSASSCRRRRRLGVASAASDEERTNPVRDGTLPVAALFVREERDSHTDVRQAHRLLWIRLIDHRGRRQTPCISPCATDTELPRA